MLTRFLFLCLVFPLVALAQPRSKPKVIVYGATAGGVMAAVAAAREGASVQLVEPGRHLGGMLTGGLSHTDYGDRAVIGGLALEFYERVAKAYQKPLYFWRGPEPHLGEKILGDWLKEHRVAVLFGQRVQAVEKEGRQIRRIRLLSGQSLAAGVFIDATYEGDLMARAGVSYAIGREGIAQYGESWAGRQPIYPDGHNFRLPVSPFVNGKNGVLLPLVNPRRQVGFGEADSAVQAYCFRLIMTNVPENRVPLTKPEGYDPARYELLRRYVKVRKPKTLGETGVIGPWVNLPNGKAEINSGGPISTNLYDGSNWAYPDADYPQRDRIWQDHLAYTQGLLYFVANDPSLPENIHREAREWGLARDEFADTGGWPHQLYVRVARRMVGEYVMTQHDLQRDTTKYDGIGMGSYNIDVRHVQRTFQWISRFPELRGETFNEGYLSIPVAPYEIPYRALLPKYDQCTNLLVPVCVSSSNLAYASIRMEPQYMILGHAAGVAAALAGKQRVPVQHVDLAGLRRRLLAQRQVLSLEGNPNGVFAQGNAVVVDDDMSRWVTREGYWDLSEDPGAGRHAITFMHAGPAEPARFTYQPPLPRDGHYQVYGWWPAGKDFATNTRLTVRHAEGTKTLALNQRETGGGWIPLGTYSFRQGREGSLTLSNEGADGTVAADAFKFERVE
jgi:hypothetical protein